MNETAIQQHHDHKFLLRRHDHECWCRSAPLTIFRSSTHSQAQSHRCREVCPRTPSPGNTPSNARQPLRCAQNHTHKKTTVDDLRASLQLNASHHPDLQPQLPRHSLRRHGPSIAIGIRPPVAEARISAFDGVPHEYILSRYPDRVWATRARVIQSECRPHQPRWRTQVGRQRHHLHSAHLGQGRQVDDIERAKGPPKPSSRMWHLVWQGGAKTCRRNHQEDHTGWHSDQRTVPRRHWAECRDSPPPLLKGWWYLLLTALADMKETTVPGGQTLSHPSARTYTPHLNSPDSQQHG